ncbi:hypothetical protein KDH_05170 [Dictyobacter sp. S3.2.2.5]|uniref:Uncharacterized protein n=1 Tax=Dictyobacter halimunensis TaxID=3026934 RepID=A0ABQ6FM79_9CHLR|nr:hypothetical protein KDH_05170 [Dictyobacter sp. S3.2.2.5]
MLLALLQAIDLQVSHTQVITDDSTGLFLTLDVPDWFVSSRLITTSVGGICYNIDKFPL